MKRPTVLSILFFLLMLSGFTSFSQTENSKNSSETQRTSSDQQKHNQELDEKWNKAFGSFQFQIINSRINPQVPTSTIEMIEQNRLEDKVNYVDYKENIRIMILPKSQISKEYKKLELFKYISTNQSH